MEIARSVKGELCLTVLLASSLNILLGGTGAFASLVLILVRLGSILRVHRPGQRLAMSLESFLDIREDLDQGSELGNGHGDPLRESISVSEYAGAFTAGLGP